ncbi:hypothetical protein C5B96_03125 [Subtercola sp. Z020]|uniref:hypothetical protein n=1 Tax=Subtercola sp. Z020 TaxID=2080582 RepID=UPI000CE8A862|nr:hypothetical protein [Subtercola sp. Z020]PPF88193.1 hypothetical protein C5B96_03125 [Subtercola sp. Z020]
MASDEALPPNVNPKVLQGIDRVLAIQRPVVLAHIRGLRKRHPSYSPEQLITALERHYLGAVTTGGAAVGASAAIPAVGTAASLALTGVETLGFLEATAMFSQSITEIHGVAIENPDRARALVMGMLMGSGGADLVQQLARQAGGAGAPRGEFWGTMVTKSLPSAAVGPVADQVKKTFLKHFLAWTGSTAVGRLLPFGVGAVVGGAGNHVLGRRVVKSARTAFGPAPAVFPPGLEPRIVLATPKEPKAPKAPKTAKPPKGKAAQEAESPKALTPPKAAKPSKPPKPSRAERTAAKNAAMEASYPSQPPA